MALNLNIDTGRLSLKNLARLVDREWLLQLGLFRPQYPPLAVEVDDGRLTLVHVDRERKKEPEVKRFRSIDLPDGALRARFGRTNLKNPAQVGAALKEALDAEAIETRGISLVLPDHLARVSLIHLGERPAGRDETLELIRWKLRKTVPFRIDEAHIDFQVFPVPDGGAAYTCMATLVQESVLKQYEQLFRDLELHAGLIDLSTFSLVNLYLPVLSAAEGDVFVLNVTGSFFALLVLRQGVPLFYRAKSFAFVEDSIGSRLGLVLREVSSSLGYYRERLSGSDPGQIYLRCVDLDVQETAAAVQGRVGCDVVAIDPSEIIPISPRENGTEPREVMLQRIAPALGAALGREP